MELALEATFMFHYAQPWDDEHRLRWAEIARALLGPCTLRSSHGMPVDQWEATTRVLCDMVRKARE
jgi:hypothetical protein